jgi:hypothetical protein
MTSNLPKGTPDTLMASAGETKAQREATGGSTILRKPLPLERHGPGASQACAHRPHPQTDPHDAAHVLLV